MNNEQRPNLREAKFWEPLADRKGWVKCNLCHRRC